MTDKEKLNAIRAEVQNYIDAAHKAHTNITESNFAHLLSFIDSLQEESKSHKPKITLGEATGKLKIDDFTKALAECIKKAQCAVVDPMAHAEIWKEELLELAKGKITMATITEDHVSFEIAKLLKEKGFDECPLFRYDDCGQLWVQGGYNKTIKWHFPAPTLQMAMKWLRKVHKIFIEPKMSKNTFLWGYRVSISNGSTVCFHTNIFNECEEACEAAIKYCLENLI